MISLMQRFIHILMMVIVIKAAVNRKQLTREECDQLDIRRINNYYYVKTEPFNITGMPADFSVHWQSRKVFFTLISDDYLKMSIKVLHKNRIRAIQMDVIGQSSTVDNQNNVVYIATDDGVYKYINGTAEYYTASGEDVMYIAVSNDGTALYIATWPQNRVHIITQNGQKQETFFVIPNGHDLTIDTKNNIYFVASKTSYILQGNHNIPIKIKGLPTNKMTGIFVSRSDKVYGMDEIGCMYIIDPENAKATLLGSFQVEGVNAFALDELDNVLIGIKGAILKYNKMEASPCSVVRTDLKKLLSTST